LHGAIRDASISIHFHIPTQPDSLPISLKKSQLIDFSFMYWRFNFDQSACDTLLPYPFIEPGSIAKDLTNTDVFQLYT
jgi:hypothetical protein